MSNDLTKAAPDAAAPGDAPTTPPRSDDAAERAVRFVAENRRGLTVVAVAITVVVGGVWFNRAATLRKEAFATRELASARLAVESGNPQLGISDLTRIVGTYGGTVAGQEAAILLANVYLRQGQAEQAANALQAFLDAGPAGHFEGPAAALLGGAYEQLGDHAAAADAYARAARATPYGEIRNEYRLDAARAATLANDTSRAAGLYEAILEGNAETQAGIEARFRLAELRKGGSGG